MANPEAPRSPDGPSPSNPLVTRRRVLGGMAGIAGLASVPSLLAACSPAATTAPSTGGAASQPPAASTPPAASGSAVAASGEVTLGSNYSDVFAGANSGVFWQEVLNSDAWQYWGSGQGNLGGVDAARPS